MAEPQRLLVVCLGNICRSPMGEGALRARLREAGLETRVEVDSAGTGDWHVGQPPDKRAIATARRHGVDIGGLRARQLSVRDFDEFDWLLCADDSNLRDVRALAPASARGRSRLFMDWAGLSGPIPDPYTGGEDHFEQVWAQVDAAALAAVERLRGDGRAD
ncbi:low molecular weight protein-tyrosine-phosphatase [Luteimonas lutimaris]|uniref:protein-tyrosine-phosphatase n=1 Tax=Luteimonas lutimaris TaxID=698645 RepID=A0ABP7MFD0_9GAMM|nr:low molecular weight protein-tyrosine-phosphatase [Luteimonas sp.]